MFNVETQCIASLLAPVCNRCVACSVSRNERYFLTGVQQERAWLTDTAPESGDANTV